MVVLVIVAFLLGAAVALGSAWLAVKVMRLTLPSYDEIGDILREHVSEEFEMYLDNVDALKEEDE